MPKNNVKKSSKHSEIDDYELDGFVNVGLPSSPHVCFDLTKNEKYNLHREKCPKDMFYSYAEFCELITKCDREHKVEKEAKEAEDALGNDLTTVEEIDIGESTPPRSSYKITKENTSLRGSTSQKGKRRRHNQPFPGLAHTYFGAPFGITERTQMEAYRLWVDSDSSDDEAGREDEGEKCCGLCVVQ